MFQPGCSVQCLSGMWDLSFWSGLILYQSIWCYFFYQNTPNLTKLIWLKLFKNKKFNIEAFLQLLRTRKNNAKWEKWKRLATVCSCCCLPCIKARVLKPWLADLYQSTGILLEENPCISIFFPHLKIKKEFSLKIICISDS